MTDYRETGSPFFFLGGLYELRCSNQCHFTAHE